MFEIADTLIQRQRLILTSIFVSTILLISCILAPLIESYHSSISARIQASYSSQQSNTSYNSPNVITNLFVQITNDTINDAKLIEAKMLSGVMTLSIGITHFEKETVQVPKELIGFTIQKEIGITNKAGDIISSTYSRFWHTEIISFIYTSHAVGSVGTSLENNISGIFDSLHGLSNIKIRLQPKGIAPIRILGDVFSFEVRIVSDGFGSFHGLAYAKSIIQPKDNVAVPVITQLRMQQANLIQSDTREVTIALMTTGAGGACDDGNGNGGYPLSWCNAPMDSASTLPYTGDPINRECTSYAYWYFTDIEGHTDFKAWGNAKYWGYSSNYPTRTTPTVGAIAVETAGAYGHVAIVQALPGQEYAGQIVPAGFVLVSEMNYDWQGHFRYSYSPLSKFSTYIYP